MSKFGKYLGYMSIEVEGDTFEIRPTLRQKQQLMAIQQKSGKDGGMSLDQWQDLHKIFKDILRTADAEATEEELEAFLMKHDINFMMKLYIAFGWAKEGDLADLKEGLAKKALEKN